MPAVGSLEWAARNSPNADTRRLAIHALWQIGLQGKATIEHALNDEDAQVRDHAIELLPDYGPTEIAVLAAFLDRPWTPSTAKAVSALGHYGPELLPAMDVLNRTAHDGPDRTTRRLAIDALAKIGAPAYPLITKLTDDPDPEIRWEAQQLLKVMRARDSRLPRP